MCDVSDGLVADLGHVATASNVVVDVESQRLSAFVTDDMRNVSAALGGADPMVWVLGGGDDHAFVATLPADNEVPEGWVPIGRVHRADTDGPRVTVDGAVPTVSGHEHRVG
jgi:thiamine-monophosphate kinase